MYCILFQFAKNVCLCYRQLSYILQSCYKTAAEEVYIRKVLTDFYKGIFFVVVPKIGRRCSLVK